MSDSRPHAAVRAARIGRADRPRSDSVGHAAANGVPAASAGDDAANGVPAASAGVRATRQRSAVAAALASVEDFRSAQDLHDMLRHQGARIGLSTVYRTLTGLADAGEVDVLRTAAGEAVYRRCSTRHHHHLVCRACGRTVEVAGPAVEQWAERVGRDHGFAEVTHSIEVFGTCSTCVTGSEGR